MSNQKAQGGILATNTSLITAAEKGDMATVKILLKNGVDVNAKDKAGWTALMKAINKGHKEIAKELINKGADVNAKNERDWMVLMKAINKGR